MRRAVILDFQTGIRDKSPYARAILVLDGKHYLFDMTSLTIAPYKRGITECMAFKCDRRGKVKNWKVRNLCAAKSSGSQSEKFDGVYPEFL